MSLNPYESPREALCVVPPAQPAGRRLTRGEIVATAIVFPLALLNCLRVLYVLFFT
jgi:hypothetical protein